MHDMADRNGSKPKKKIDRMNPGQCVLQYGLGILSVLFNIGVIGPWLTHDSRLERWTLRRLLRRMLRGLLFGFDLGGGNEHDFFLRLLDGQILVAGHQPFSCFEHIAQPGAGHPGGNQSEHDQSRKKFLIDDAQ